MSFITQLNPPVRALCIATFAFTATQISLPALANTIEEIVVTARKRSENLQDVPAAVSAFSGRELVERGVEDIREVARITPNLTINETSGLQPGSVQAFIRGIGSDPGFDQGVGIYVDDIYLNRTFGALLGLYDVERIEVLKGPQGNLYGRNTIGGAIKYVTREPSEQTRGFVEVKTGTDSLRKVKAGISGSLSDSVSGSFATSYERRDGYQTNLFDGDDYASSNKRAYRLSLLWNPGDTVKVKLNTDYFKDESDPLIPIRVAVDTAAVGNFQTLLTLANNFVPGAGFLGPDDPPIDAGLPTNEDHANTAHTTNGFKLYEIETGSLSLTVDWAINENWSVKSVTARRSVDNVAPYDFDGSPQVFIHTVQPAENTDLSQELQFNYTGDAINAVVGLYYLDGERDSTSKTSQSALLRLTTATYREYSSDIRELTSKSIYANLDWDINDQWQLSLGGRYTRDEKDTARYSEYTTTHYPVTFLNLPRLETSPIPLSPLGEQAIPKLPFFRAFLPHRDQKGTIINRGNTTTVITYPENNFGNEDWSEFTPSAKLRYTPSDKMMMYAGYSSGFKAGGFLPSGRSPILPSFEPETVKTYSLGFKSTLADGSVRLNAELFLNDYQEKQVAVVELDPVTKQLNQTSKNVGEVESRGGEVELLWLPPVDGLTINLNLGFLDVDIKKLIDQIPGTQTVGDVSDHRELGYSPELTWQARIQYRFPLGEAGFITVGADADYRDEMFTDSPIDTTSEFFTRAVSEDRTLYNAFVTYRSNDERWRVTLEGKNLGDKRIIENTYNVSSFILGGYNRGRTWGLTFAYDLGQKNP